MHRRRFLRLSGAVLSGSLMPLAGATAEAGPVKPGGPSTIALGAYISGAPDDPAKIDQFTSLVGVAPATVMWYQDWAHPGIREFSATKMNAVVARNAMPMVTWEPWDYTAGVSQPAYALSNIIAGTYDAYISAWARAAAAWGKPMYLRFGHEMNGSWYPWCVGVNGNTAAQFVTVWRRLFDVFRQAGAANVRWVWSVNVVGPAIARVRGVTTNQFSPIYPGDAYVHWAGMEGYNWGTTQSWSSWADLATVFGATYSGLTSVTARPMMISETASTELGGDKAAWIKQGLLNDVPQRFPRVRAINWFDENKETDWRVDSSAAALAAYTAVAKSAIYQGRLQ
jgi:beta-mannanase